MTPETGNPAGGDDGESVSDLLGGGNDGLHTLKAKLFQRPARQNYPDAPGFKGDLDTGRNAARSFSGRAKTVRARTLEILERGPATAEQVAEITGDHWMIVRARCSELRAAGLIDDSKARGKGALGGTVVVWRPTSPLERAAFQRAKEGAQ